MQIKCSFIRNIIKDNMRKHKKILEFMVEVSNQYYKRINGKRNIGGAKDASLVAEDL